MPRDGHESQESHRLVTCGSNNASQLPLTATKKQKQNLSGFYSFLSTLKLFILFVFVVTFSRERLRRVLRKKTSAELRLIYIFTSSPLHIHILTYISAHLHIYIHNCTSTSLHIFTSSHRHLCSSSSSHIQWHVHAKCM